MNDLILSVVVKDGKIVSAKWRPIKNIFPTLLGSVASARSVNSKAALASFKEKYVNSRTGNRRKSRNMGTEARLFDDEG